MNRYARSNALTMGLILIAFGVIFLIENFYAPFSAWRLLIRYWPVLPIIIGIKKLVLYFTWPTTPAAPNTEPSKE
jgi:hypothetical protein